MPSSSVPRPGLRILLVFTILLLRARAGLTPAEIAAALDSGASISWESSAAVWPLVAGSQAHDGTDALRTPALPHSKSEELSGTVEGPGVLRGWVRVSSEKYHDALTVVLDGATLVEFSGQDQRMFEVKVARGAHVVTLAWAKDATRVEGSDAAWLDEVIFTPGAVSVEEGLDIAGTPAAPRIVFSDSDGVLAWRAVADATGAHLGGDALYSSARSSSGEYFQRTLQATVNQPSLVTFWSRAINSFPQNGAGSLEVKPEGGGQILDSSNISGWTRWRVLLSAAGDSLLIEHSNGNASSPAVEDGYYLDDWTVEPLAPVSISEALDAPALTFAADWGNVSNGTAANAPWRELASSGAAAGVLTYDGTDALVTQPLARISEFFSPFGERQLSTTVTGPGRMSFWWKRSGVLDGQSTARVVTAPAGNLTNERAVSESQPVRSEWQQVTMEIPPGAQRVQWRWSAGSEVLMLDQLVWTPVSVAVPAPSVSDALDLTGSLNISSTGNWSPAGWTGAGFANDDTLTWQSLAVPSEDGPPLAASVNGPGWVSFGWRLLGDEYLRFDVDGVFERLWPVTSSGGSFHGDRPWQQVARRLPAGNHTLTWRPNGTASSFGDGRVRLDALRFQSSPPSWVDALESSGIDDWQQGRAPWPIVTDVTHDGTDALRAPVVGAEGYVAVASKITGPGTLRFWWRMDDPAPQMDSSGNYYGNRAVFRGTESAADAILTTSGAWQEVVAELSSNYSYDLRWSFHRSTRATLPGDGLWIDEVSFTKATAVSMAAALDAPGLTWTWQGPFTAVGGAGFSQARGNAVMQLPAEVGFPLPEVWLQTTVPGPGLVEIKSNRGQGSPPFELWVDGAKLDRLADWNNPAKYEVYGSGPHVCRVMFPSRYELVELDYFSYTPLQLVTLAEALDLPPAPAPERKASVIALRDAAAAHDGTDAVLMDTEGSFDGRAELKWKVSAPARVSFWWRGEGAADGSALANSYPGGPGSRKGPFAWEENTSVVTGFGDSIFAIIADDGPTQPYKVWVDQVRIEPFAVISPAEALHLAAGTATTGGDGQWRCFRPPGAAGVEDGAYAAAYLNNSSLGPIWLEARVTGPALLHYHVEYSHESRNHLTVTRTPAAGGSEVTAGPDGPLAVPPGEHLVRWSMRRDFGWPDAEAVMTLTGVRLTPPLDIAPHLGLPGLTFTSTSSPEGLWYGDSRAPHDSTVFTDDTLVRIAGSATLETTLTGPGWLLFEAEMAPALNWQSWPEASGMDVRLLPPGPDPDPLPAPVLTVNYSGYYYGQVRKEPVAQNVWIPAGPWRLQFIGRNAATLNNFRFVSGLDATSAAVALDLPPGVLASFPSNKGGAVASPVKHDSTDALQLLAGEPSQDPLLSLTFTGPAVVSGWLRNGQIKPYVWSGDFDPANAPEPGVVWNESRYGIRVFQNGQRLGVPEEDAIAPGEWSPLRIVVPAGGPQVISFGLVNTSSGDRPEYVLQLDEFTVTPLAPVTLGEALDSPGLTWSAALQSWSGGASAIANPDGADAAWILAREDTPGWLETTVTGPGALRFWSWGGGNLNLTIGGLPQPALQASSFEGSGSRWRSHVVPVPQGTHVVRLEPANWDWFGETALVGLDHMEWEPGPVTTLTAALDVPAGVALTTGGPEAANWTGTAVAALSHDGADAVGIRAPLTDRAWLEYAVTGPAIVSCWQAVADSARLTFTMDDLPVRIPGNAGGGGGIIILGIGGDDNPRGARGVDAPDVPQPGRSEWYREEFTVPAGTHTLRWSVGGDFPKPLPGEVLFRLDELIVAALPLPVSLTDAIDVAGMTVTTNFPDKIFAVIVPGMAHDSVDCAVVTGTGYYEEAEQARLALAVPGPGLVRYRWRPLGTSDTYPQARVAGLAQQYVMREIGQATGEGWREAWVVQPLQGTQQVTWHIERENHGFVIDEVSFASLPDVAAATGAPELGWTTGSGSPWLALPQLPQSNRTQPAAAYSMVQQGQTGWIGTQLQGPGRLTFTASGGLLLFNGLALYDYGFNGNAHTLVVPPGSHELRWQAEGLVQLSLSSVRWVPSATADPVADALDAPALPWLFPVGYGTWTRQTTETTDGVDALRYTGVDGVTSSWIQTVLPLPGPAGAIHRRAGRFNTSAAEPVWAEWQTTGGIIVPAPQTITLSAWTTANYGPGTIDFDAFHYTPVPVSLAEALDSPGLVWETSAELPFVGYASTNNDLAFDRTDAVIARYGAPGAWLQTTVTGPARIAYFASGTGGVFTVNGSPPPQEYNSDWLEHRFEVGAGQHVLRWLKVGRNHWGLDAFSVTPVAAGASLADALDQPGPWRLPVESNWTLSTADTAGGPDAALFTTAYYYHPLELSVQGPGRLEFDVRMSPHNNGSSGAQSLVSAPYFYSQAWFTGAWQHFVIDAIPPGAQALQWHLHSVTGAEPPAGLDAVSFTPYANVPLAAALDAAGLTVITNPDAPWSGYAAGTAAADGEDAAISSASQESWLEIDAPPGAGELSFMGRAPGVSFGRPPDVHGPELAMPDGSFLRLPQQWKRMRTSIAADFPRPMRISARQAAFFWIDDLKWNSAAASLAGWFAMHNLSANSDLNSDADGDSQPLVFEYAFGLDPNAHAARDPAAPPEAAMPVFDYARYPNASANDPSVLRCRYLRRSGGTGLSYEVFFSNDLGPLPTWTENYFTVTTELDNEWESVMVYDRVPGWAGTPEKRFGRVRVSYSP